MAVNIHHPVVPVAALPFHLLNLPHGSWGISYDISTNKTQFDAPDGWFAWRGAFLVFLNNNCSKALRFQVQLIGY